MSSGTAASTIACSGPIAMELQHLTAELIARINTHLGSPTVKRLRFVQTLVPPRQPASLPPAPPGPALVRQAEEAVSGLPQGELRSALASLGAAVLDAEARRKGST